MFSRLSQEPYSRQIDNPKEQNDQPSIHPEERNYDDKQDATQNHRQHDGASPAEICFELREFHRHEAQRLN